MKADAQPRDVNGSTTDVTMCSARKISDVSASVRWTSSVRSRGQDGRLHRTAVTIPRHTTIVKSTCETMAEPRVLYQRMESTG